MSRETRQVRQSALADQRYRRYFPASCFSSLGSWMLRFLFGWSAWELTGSAAWVGIVAGLMLAPAIVLSPVFGILSDRINPRHGLMGSMLAHALMSFAGGLASVFDAYSLPTLVALAFTMGAVTSAHTPMRLALVPLLVERGALPSAVGLSAMTFNTARIIGPAVGAWIITWSGTGVAYFAAVAMFLISFSILFLLRGVGHREPKPREPFIQQFRAGLGYLSRSPAIRLIFGFTLVNGFLGRTVLELLPAVSGQLLSGDSADLATLTACAGVGSIGGGLIVSRQAANPSRILSLLSGGLMVGALLLLGMGWYGDLILLAGVVMVVSMTTTMAGTGCQTLTQLTADEDYRGRILSLWTVIVMGSPAIGAFIVGVIAEWFGFAFVVPVLAVAMMIWVFWLFRGRHRLVEH